MVLFLFYLCFSYFLVDAKDRYGYVLPLYLFIISYCSLITPHAAIGKTTTLVKIFNNSFWAAARLFRRLDFCICPHATGAYTIAGRDQRVVVVYL
jgi:hypothetical protein